MTRSLLGIAFVLTGCGNVTIPGDTAEGTGGSNATGPGGGTGGSVGVGGVATTGGAGGDATGGTPDPPPTFPSPKWVYDLGLIGNPTAAGIGVDGAIYVAGFFDGDGVVAIGGASTAGADGQKFLGRLSVEGQAHWLTTFPQSTNAGVRAIAAAPDGSVYLCGGLIDTVDFGLGPFGEAPGGLYFARFAPDGALISASMMEGTEGATIGGCAVDGQGNVLIGVESGISGPAQPVVVAQYSPEGSLQWSLPNLTLTNVVHSIVAVGPDGTIYLSLESDGPVDWGDGLLPTNEDAVLSAFTSTHDPLWWISSGLIGVEAMSAGDHGVLVNGLPLDDNASRLFSPQAELTWAYNCAEPEWVYGSFATPSRGGWVAGLDLKDFRGFIAAVGADGETTQRMEILHTTVDGVAPVDENNAVLFGLHMAPSVLGDVSFSEPGHYIALFETAPP